MKPLIIALICLTHFSFSQTANDYYQSAQIDFDKKSFKSALRKIENAFRLDSSNVDYFFIKAQTLYELQKYQESYDTYSEAIILFPKKSFLYNNRGNFLLSFQEFDLAITDFTSAIDIAENDSTKYHYITNRAAAKLSKRDFDGAYRDLLIAYNFDSTDITTLTNLGAVCDEIGKGNETLKYLLKAVEVDPSFYPAYGNIGFKYQEMGQHEKAIEYFDMVIQFNPIEPLGYSNRSFNKLKLGQLKGAMRDIQKSIQLYPENSYAYRTRALIYIENKKYDNACKDLQNAIDKGFTVSYGQEVEDLQKEHCKK